MKRKLYQFLRESSCKSTISINQSQFSEDDRSDSIHSLFVIELRCAIFLFLLLSNSSQHECIILFKYRVAGATIEIIKFYYFPIARCWRGLPELASIGSRRVIQFTINLLSCCFISHSMLSMAGESSGSYTTRSYEAWFIPKFINILLNEIEVRALTDHHHVRDYWREAIIHVRKQLHKRL